MAAPKGNQFWKLRSKHGRDKLFATPELLWDAACEYFQWCDENPLYKAEQSRAKSSKKETEIGEEGIQVKDTGIIEMPVMRPFTIEGLCHYLDCNTKYLNIFERDLTGKTDKTSQDFNNVITRIRETIYRQKFEGAASGFFQQNIIARDLGLSDKKDHSHKIDKTNLPEWFD